MPSRNHPPKRESGAKESTAQQWRALILDEPEDYYHPEIRAAIAEGQLIPTERAKEIARQLIRSYVDDLPSMMAIRDAIRAVREAQRTTREAEAALWRAFESTCDGRDAETYPTANAEYAFRAGVHAGRLLFGSSAHADVPTEQLLEKASNEAAFEMGARAASVNKELIDPRPVVVCGALRRMHDISQLYDALFEAPAGRGRDLFSFAQLYQGRPLITLPVGGAPAQTLAMYVAWLLQDAAERPMQDHRVVVLLEEAIGEPPPGAPKLVPSVKTIADWRRERALIPELGPRNRSYQNPR